jgi:hypothetical protein
MKLMKILTLAVIGIGTSAFADCPDFYFECGEEGGPYQTLTSGRKSVGLFSNILGGAKSLFSKGPVENPDKNWSGDGCKAISDNYDSTLKQCEALGGVHRRYINKVKVDDISAQGVANTIEQAKAGIKTLSAAVA